MEKINSTIDYILVGTLPSPVQFFSFLFFLKLTGYEVDWFVVLLPLVMMISWTILRIPDWKKSLENEQKERDEIFSRLVIHTVVSEEDESETEEETKEDGAD